jgi:hypothetical protein
MFRFHCRPIQFVVFPSRPAEDVIKLTKGLQGGTQLIALDDGETENKGNSNLDSN